MRISTALTSLLLAAATLTACAAETQVKAKDNTTTISPNVEQQGEETTEVEVAPEGDDRDDDKPKHDDDKPKHGDHDEG